jgi:hypothetical protein
LIQILFAKLQSGFNAIMKKKFVDFTVTTFTVASSALLIVTLFLDLVYYEADSYGSFVLDAYQLGCF